MGDINHEPSMEEILASIKRIIAEDGEGAPAPRRGRDRRAPAAMPQGRPADEADDGVLELTNRLDGDGGVAQPASLADRGEPAPASAADETAPQSDEEAGMADDSATIERLAADPIEPPLVSGAAREASRQSIAALSAMIVKPEQNGPETLEGLVRDMLRPMLKEWLDARLPGLVEQVVQREIAKIVDGLA